MTSIRRAGLPGVVVALLGLSVTAGCGDGRQRQGALPRLEPGERYARRYLPFEPVWIAESEIPTEPPTNPKAEIWELSVTLDDPGPEEQRVAAEWVERCYEAARRHGWYKLEQGLADGYERPPDDPVHYRNREYILDDRILDPDRPEFLMYYRQEDGSKGLAGFMFLTRNVEEKGPQFAGRLTLWHFHTWRDPQCVVDGNISLGFATLGKCDEGTPRHRSPEMIHTWLVDHPEGPFGTSMVLLPEVVAAGLEKRLRERGF